MVAPHYIIVNQGVSHTVPAFGVHEARIDHEVIESPALVHDSQILSNRPERVLHAMWVKVSKSINPRRSG